MGCCKFKLESLYLNLNERALEINGKVIPMDGLTDFSLTADEKGWHLVAKKDIIAELSEKRS